MELVADEVGAGMRFATVAISKVQREDSQGNTTTSRSGPSQAKAQQQAEDIYGEEPF